MSRPKVDPVIKERELGGTSESHPSYGMVSFNRQQQTPPANLFGSSIKHQTLISLTIRRGTKERDLSRDWYFGGEELIEVLLSPNQFAEAITHMNMG